MAFENPSDSDATHLPPVLDVPVLAIRNTVIFPVLAFPINVGRAKSVRAVEEALATESKLLGIVAQRDPKTEDPGPSDLYPIGTVVKILKSVKIPGGKLNVIIQGLSRVRVEDLKDGDTHLSARLAVIAKDESTNSEIESLMGTLRELAQKNHRPLAANPGRGQLPRPLHRRAGRVGRYRCEQPQHPAGREAGSPRDHRHQRADGKGHRVAQ